MNFGQSILDYLDKRAYIPLVFWEWGDIPGIDSVDYVGSVSSV